MGDHIMVDAALDAYETFLASQPGVLGQGRSLLGHRATPDADTVEAPVIDDWFSCSRQPLRAGAARHDDDITAISAARRAYAAAGSLSRRERVSSARRWGPSSAPRWTAVLAWRKAGQS